MVYNIFKVNTDVVIFIYGSIFFLMGFGILLINHQHSRFRLAQSLHWLALFGIVHAFADWGHLFIPIQREYASEQTYIILRTIRIVLNALSFALLFQFGISLLLQTKRTWSKLKVIPVIIFVLWFIQLVLHKSVIGYEGEDLLWIRVSDIWSRYIIALPAGILAGYAIFAQRDEFRKYGHTKFIRMLKLAAASLLTYGIVAGIIVPEGPVGLATHLNSEMFFSFTGVPIELLRAIVGSLVAFSMLKIIQVFDKEYIYRIQESEKEKAILEERNRIAQDLHDGIIQSMYATNLQLEVAKHLMTTNLEEAKGKLTLSISRSNAIISQIRQYIRATI